MLRGFGETLKDLRFHAVAPVVWPLLKLIYYPFFKSCSSLCSSTPFSEQLVLVNYSPLFCCCCIFWIMLSHKSYTLFFKISPTRDTIQCYNIADLIWLLHSLVCDTTLHTYMCNLTTHCINLQQMYMSNRLFVCLSACQSASQPTSQFRVQVTYSVLVS